MSIRVQKQTQEVAGGRLASSAQPPRATPVFPHRLSPSFTPQPFPFDLATGTNGALLEGLRCLTASRPLSNSESDLRKNRWMLWLERNQR